MGSNLAEGDGFLRTTKIYSMPSFRVEVKPLVSCCKILWHVNFSKYEQRYIVRPNSSYSLPVHPALLLDNPACRIARKLWWTNQEFSHVSIISPCFSMLIYHLRDEQ
jgi:hypothetical protein